MSIVDLWRLYTVADDGFLMFATRVVNDTIEARNDAPREVQDG